MFDVVCRSVGDYDCVKLVQLVLESFKAYNLEKNR